MSVLDNIKFERISLGTEIMDGGRINSIIEDSQGFIWFGSGGALARYDGCNFKIYSHDRFDKRSIPNDDIRDIYEDKSGNLTISSFELFIEFNKKSEEFKEIDYPFKDKLVRLWGVVEDNLGVYWIMLDDGLYRFDRIKNEYELFKKENNKDNSSINCNFISCLYFDQYSENLYVGTKTGGVNIYDFNTKKFSYLLTDNIAPEVDIRVRCIFRDSRKSLWVGTADGLYLLNTENEVVSYFKNDPSSNSSISHDLVYCICEDKNGLIWIGTEKGLNSYSYEENKFRQFIHDSKNQKSIFYDTITSILCSKTNVIFFGTYGGGIGKFDLELSKFSNLSIVSSDPNNLTSNHICTMCTDSKNNLWVGTYRGGFYKCIPSEEKGYNILEFKELSGLVISGITFDGKEKIWVTSNKTSLCYININSNEIRFVDKDIFSKHMTIPFQYISCQCRDRINPGYLWLSVNDKRLILFDTDNNKVIENKITFGFFRNIYCLFIDSSGNLWIGGDEGVFKYDSISETVVKYFFEENVNFNTRTIIEDRQNNLWFGTRDSGFFRLKKGENKFERYSTAEGLPGNCVCGMAADDKNYLWVCLIGGLVKFNIDDKTYDSFIESGNITLDVFNPHAYHIARDGVIYLGNVYGIVHFKPEEVTSNSYIPDLLITDFQIFYESVKPSPENPFLKKSISYADDITLSYRESVITFEYAALIYNNAKRNQYAYKMEGFDEDWVYCGTRRTATYTNLDPGEYTFRVKGSNNDGLWNEEGTSLKVTITPPWYKTLLFKGIVGMGVIGGIGSYYRKRIQQLNKEKKQQEDFTKKLIESQENERKRVAAELHDSLGQDLLIIKNKLLTNIKKAEDRKSVV